MEFYKYQGTGNDFIITTMESVIKLPSAKTISLLCDRRFGIGADGFIVLQKEEKSDFRMIYFNSDGKESTMCGNGGRCAVAHAHFLGWIKDKTEFIAIDGLHKGEVFEKEIAISMVKPSSVESWKNGYWINTGSPHLVIFLDENLSLWKYDVVKNGRQLRNEKEFQPDGVNVNFVKKTGGNNLQLRTYERGVEDETLSCGTGNVAAACVFAHLNEIEGKSNFLLKNKGGELKVQCVKNKKLIDQVWLRGLAKQVFKGEIDIKDFF